MAIKFEASTLLRDHLDLNEDAKVYQAKHTTVCEIQTGEKRCESLEKSELCGGCRSRKS